MAGLAAFLSLCLTVGGAGGAAQALFAGQLTLNLCWSFLFFGLQWIGLALAEIVLLLAAIVCVMMVFRRVDRWAGSPRRHQGVPPSPPDSHCARPKQQVKSN